MNLQTVKNFEFIFIKHMLSHTISGNTDKLSRENIHRFGNNDIDDMHFDKLDLHHQFLFRFDQEPIKCFQYSDLLYQNFRENSYIHSSLRVHLYRESSQQPRKKHADFSPVLKNESFLGLGEFSENLTHKNIDSKTYESKFSELYHDFLVTKKFRYFTSISF